MSSTTIPVVGLPGKAAPMTSGAVTILVVDDNLIDRRLVARFLEAAGGWSPVFVTNGVEALKVLEKSARGIL